MAKREYESEKEVKFHLANALHFVGKALDLFPVHAKLLELRKQIEETAKNFDSDSIGDVPEREFPMLMPASHREKFAVKWSFIERHRKQIEHNHGQTLEELERRGGLAPIELLIASEGKNWHESHLRFLKCDDAVRELKIRMSKHESTD